jgi:hypothetical protein
MPDYGTSEIYPQWEGFVCHCGADDCRGKLTPFDWQSIQFQRKYGGHVLKHVAEKMAREHTRVCSLAPCLLSCFGE